MPIECEWPTTSVGADPMGFTLGTYQYSFDTKNSMALKASLILYTDRNFTEPYLGRPVFTCRNMYDCDERVYLGIQLDNTETDVKLTLEHLWATPTLPNRMIINENDVYFAWVINGCPEERIEIYKNGKDSFIQLSVPVFAFSGYREVYFHAQVKACKSDDCIICDLEISKSFEEFLKTKKDVTSRLRRSSTIINDQIMSIGPISVHRFEPNSIISATLFMASLLLFIILLLLHIYSYFKSPL